MLLHVDGSHALGNGTEGLQLVALLFSLCTDQVLDIRDVVGGFPIAQSAVAVSARNHMLSLSFRLVCSIVGSIADASGVNLRLTYLLDHRKHISMLNVVRLTLLVHFVGQNNWLLGDLCLSILIS